MKKLYWRPNKVSRSVLVVIACISLSCLFLAEHFKTQVEQPFHDEKIAAAELSSKAFKIVKQKVKKMGFQIEKDSDPALSGLIGELMSPVTSNTGHLDAKQTTINPNFSAVFIDMLKKAGVEKGDAVAVGASGSFPALNICLYSAMQVLGLKPIIISSASGSQWGANRVGLTWLDMERLFLGKKVFSFGSVAASMGGIEDRGLGMSKKGKKILEDLIEKRELQYINKPDFLESLDERMSIFTQYAGQNRIKAYINLGGGTVSVGKSVGKRLYKPGLNTHLPFGASGIDSIMTRFSRRGIPVIHITKIVDLAERYGLTVTPAEMPPIGEGKIYFQDGYNVWLALICLLVILASLYVFIRSDLGYRIVQAVQTTKSNKNRPEQMV